MQYMYGHKRISIWNFLTEAIAETPQHISKTFSEKWSIKKGANIFKLVETNVWAGSYWRTYKWIKGMQLEFHLSLKYQIWIIEG